MKHYIVFISLLIGLVSCKSTYTDQKFSVTKDSLEFSIIVLDKNDSVFLNRYNVLNFNACAGVCIVNKGKSSIEYISKDSNLTNITIEYHTINNDRWNKNLYSDFSLNNNVYKLGANEEQCSYLFFPKKNIDSLILNFNYKKYPGKSYSNHAVFGLSIKENKISSIW